MSQVPRVLHMLCGKAASGESTLRAELVREPLAIIVAQDHWMARLYPDELKTVADQVRLVPRLLAAMGPHLTELLRAGLSVMLDCPANTVVSRAWMRGIFETAAASHKLHVLAVPDEICLQRLQARNAVGTHRYTVSRSDSRR